MFYGRFGEPVPSMPRTRSERRSDGLDEEFERHWSRLWFDTAGTGGWAPAVAFAASIVGPHRLMWGSDFPLESHSATTVIELRAMLDELGLGAGDRAAIAGGTAGELLALGSPLSTGGTAQDGKGAGADLGRTGANAVLGGTDPNAVLGGTGAGDRRSAEGGER